MAKNGFSVMDSDMHIVEPNDLFEKYLDAPYKHQAPKITRVRGQRVGVFLFQGHAFPTVDVEHPDRNVGMASRADAASKPMRDKGYTGPTQIEAMDMEGIDIAIMFPTVALYIPNGMDNVDPGLSAAVCRAYNNWLYDFCQTDPARMKVCAMLPMHDTGEAIKEAQRAVKELGAVGVYLRPNFVNGRTLHSGYYHPLWSALQELDVPVGFHEGTGSVYFQDGSEFGDNRLMRHAASHPIGMMKAIMSMICGGVFEVFPHLRAAYLEANAGWVPFWMARIDRDYELYGQWDARILTRKPSDYFRTNCYVGTEADETELKYTLDAYGDSNIVFSTDYPHHDSEFPYATEEFLKMPDVSMESKKRILWDNCSRLYNIG